MKHPEPTGQRSTSVVELVIGGAAVVAVVGILTHFLVSSSEARNYSQRLHHVAGINQEMLAEIQEQLRSAVRVMTNDQASRGFQDILEVSAPPLDSSTLPTVEPEGIFEREMHARDKTGNALLFARHAWSTEYQCSSGSEYHVPVFRFVYYYLTSQGPGPQPDSNIGLDLCRFVSEPFADAVALDSIANPTDRSEVLRHLINQTPDQNGGTHERVEAVWDRRSLLVSLRQIDAATGTLTVNPIGSRPSPWSIRRADNLSSNGLLAPRQLSVVSNHAQPSYQVGRFSIMDFRGDGFPHGLEVQIVGPSFATEVMLRLVIASDNPTGLQAKSDMRSDVSLGDFSARRLPR